MTPIRDSAATKLALSSAFIEALHALRNQLHFSRKQTNQFGTDMQALYLVLQPSCARPEAFFPCIRDNLKLLTMNKEAVKQLLVALASKESEKCMQFCAISHLSLDQVDKILRNMKF
ncbi:hypothetical protein CRYUN_Cryun12cG0001200 [Craigia yunnanensis]